MSATIEAASVVRSCIEPSEAPVRQSNPWERDLVQQLKTGNETALREVVQRYQSRIYRVAYGILANRHDAEEIAQQVFVKVYFSVRSFNGRGSLFTWIYRIAVNECYSFLRKKRSTLLYESDSGDNSACTRVQMIPDPYPTSDRVTLQRDLLNKFLERIPEKDRHLLLLRELEGYSVKQVAQATGMNENTIKMRLFRTRQRLAKAAAQLRCV
jgi:RNA polymerase sigma-70 factor, ECF subfamily